MSTEYVTTDLPEAKFKIFTGLLRAFEADDGAPRLSGVASSTTRDHHGDTMLETALRDMEAAANGNMTIFLNHSYNVPEDVAGSVSKATVVQRGYDGDGNPNWDLDMDIHINRDNERAVKAWSAIKNGTKLGLSIGAMIPSGGATRDKDTGALTIARLSLLETSIVSIPANPRSWISNAVKALNLAEDEHIKASHAAIAVYPSAWVETTSTNNSVTFKVDTDIEVEEALMDPEIQRPTCPECGGHKGSPQGGCTASFHKGIDDPSSQEATKSEPGNEDGALPALIESAESEIDLEPIMHRSVEGILSLLETTTAKLADARDQIDSEKRARSQAETERDEAARMAQELFAQANSIFERLAQMPVGRKTAFTNQREAFEDLDGVYSEQFRRLLNKGD